MYEDLLKQLEAAIGTRNPKLAGAFRNGLPIAKLQRRFAKERITGMLAAIESVYSWKNGTRTDVGLTGEQASVFPIHYYIFLEFDMMCSHFAGFAECAANHTWLEPIVGQFFPVLWNGSNQYLAVDLKEGSQVVHLDMQSKAPTRMAYGKFEEFLNDATRANKQNTALACFSTT